MDEPAPPSDGSASSGAAPKEHLSLRNYLVSRGSALGSMLLCAGVATAIAASYPPKNEEGIVALLAHAQGGIVAPGDFVWEPSRGFLEDLLIGRRILFLARKTPDSPRDLYRARVTVTRQGRPMHVGSVVDISNTDLADERDLTVVENTAALSSEAYGHIQNIECIDLRSHARTSSWQRIFSSDLADVTRSFVSFFRPPVKVKYEITDHALVMALGDEKEPAMVDFQAKNLSLDGDRFGAYVTDPEPPLSSPKDLFRSLRCKVTPSRCIDAISNPLSAGPAPTVASYSPDAVPHFPPADGFQKVELAGWEGTVSPVYATKVRGVHLYALDMRQLKMEIAVASRVPVSRTGHYAKFRSNSLNGARIAIVGPSDLGAAAVDQSVVIAPFLNTVGYMADGPASVMGVGKAGPPNALSVLAFPVRSDTQKRERSLLCGTRSGHLVYAWGASETPQSMSQALEGVDCALTLPIEGLGGMGMSLPASHSDSLSGATSIDPAMSIAWSEAGQAAPVLLFQRIKDGPSVSPPRGTEWVPDSGSQPEPTFSPAIYGASIETLGAAVQIRLFMPQRFDWVMRAGDKEKTHRLGGTFAKTLDDVERGRAFFAAGLGIGKRRAPLGLRISGSTGHAFHHQGGILEAGANRLVASASPSDDPVDDASELPLTSSGGAILAAGRERGPREVRADICALADGTVLYAEADFDSHEATATALSELGCQAVVAMDRGAEQAGWSETRERLAPAHESTTLFALARSAPGSLQIVH